MGFVAVLVYSGIGFVDNLRNLRFPASAAGLCRVRGYLNLDICCVRGVNSLSRGLRRASSLWEGASGAPGKFLIAPDPLAQRLTACALSAIAARCQLSQRESQEHCRKLPCYTQYFSNEVNGLAPPLGELARERLRGRNWLARKLYALAGNFAAMPKAPSQRGLASSAAR